MVKPVISTVLLNWNRCYLLEKTIDSYLKTISVPFELIIIDNGSTDGSKDFIEYICKKYSNCDAILLPNNHGGKAINLGLNRAKAKFLHVSENDLTYRPGWDKKMLEKFDKFPQLGQLSLFSPFIQKELKGTEEFKNVYKRGQGDCAIYVTEINVGTSSMFRRVLWDKGVRWRNINSRKFKFPDDRSFSKDVMGLGYLVAWNDEFLVTNHGHQIDEFCNNIDYYLENYKSKSWMGIKGLEERLRRAGYRLEKTDCTESGYRIAPIDKK